MHPLELNIRRLLVDHGLPGAGARILIGVSGGADSTALMHILAALRENFGMTLAAAYIDHGLRPEETPREQAMVREAAACLGMAFMPGEVDAAGLATGQKISLEHAARDLRYQALAALGREWGAKLLAVGHTADDQAEGLLLRLFRAGGRKALAGMRLHSGWIIRPLLQTGKAELLAYLGEKGIGFCHDSSNDDPRFLRNRIRGHLLPLLEREYDPGMRGALLKSAANLSEDEDLLEGLLQEVWDKVVEMKEPEPGGFCGCRLLRGPFHALHPALQRRLLERLLWRIGASARYTYIVALRRAVLSGRTQSGLHLGRGLRVRIGREALAFSWPQGKGPWRGDLPGGGEMP